ncbi:MAG: phage major capsid protein [Niabella sp.]|nr:phage major capsid protein [Niabella sp.]
MKLKFNKEGKSEETLKAYEAMEKDVSIEGALSKDDVSSQVAEELKAIKTQLDDDNPEGLISAIKILRQRLDDIEAKEEKTDAIGYKPTLISKEDFEGLKKAISEGKTNHEILIKAAATITTANFTNAPHSFSYEVDRTINSAPTPEMIIYNRLVKSTTNSRTIYWTNRKNEEGGAAFIAEGALKPLKDWERAEENSVAKKVAVMATLTTEALEDVAQLEQEVNEVLSGEVVQEIADAILNSTESSTALKGIIPVATSYTTTALDDKVDAPNHADAIRAAMLQLRLLRFSPTVVFLNPGDAALLDLTKDSNGNYIKLQIDGVLQKIDVVETTEIAAGKFLLMDERKWKIRIYKGIHSRWGLNADDFSHNRISVVFEARLHSYANSLDAGAVLYGDFATIEAAIAKPAA